MMDSVSVGELKADFSNILEKVQKNGKSYIIEYGKKHKKVAKLIPYEDDSKEPRKLGILQGKGSFEIHKDFKISDEELFNL